MRKFVLFAIVCLLLALPVAAVYAAPPPDGPPGLERAIAAQEANTDRLLDIPGVVGTAVGIESGKAVVKILTERPNVSGLPKSLDGVPVVVQVTGKITALRKPAPSASFTYTSNGYTVNFNASSSSGTQLSFQWSFGDGNTGSGITETHTYQQASTYTVILTVTDKFGSTGTSEQNIAVPSAPVNNPPVASFTYSVTGLTCNLDGSSSSDTDGTITAYNWNFGDGNTGSDVIVSHTYQQASTYTVTLTVTDDKGAIDTDSKSITVGEVIDPKSYFERPVPIGVSSGTERLTYYRGKWYYTTGTLGARVTDGSAVFALSNNHVYALENTGVIGDRILQPGRTDMTGGGTPDEIDNAVIGTLYDFVPIVFSRRANNKVDAAIAQTTTGEVGSATPSNGYGTPTKIPTFAEFGMSVQKYGRTTSFTKGTVTGINATVLISYWSGTARFVNQVIIEGETGSFSDSGDSGSLIVTQSDNQPVALLFAGSSTVTIGNPIDEVLNAFGVTIDGE